ncbi:unnamed protein product [Pocillopora meandrina]|uniref:Uncharacterized protein n=1 Tax=Pocillopora meandrina TaxID=46732 RepID=A0AAU9XHQ6_9CNID|nr:unnamed protein product [Pocillopora meandrina]
MEKILALIAVSLGKKVTVYAVGRYYGFPRLYRRFAEFNRRVTSNRQTLRRRQEAMKFVFRVPNKILAFFRISVAIKLLDHITHVACIQGVDMNLSLYQLELNPLTPRSDSLTSDENKDKCKLGD